MNEMVDRISGSNTGLAIAVEESANTLPTTPKWFAKEPNTYSATGSTVKTAPRNFINAGKKIQKGPVVDKDSQFGYNEDLTFDNAQLELEAFLLADARETASTQPLNGTAVTITGVVASSDTYTAASGLGVFAANDLVLGENFTNSANNGLQLVSSAGATGVVVGDGLVDETPGATAKLTVVGYQFDTAELDVVASADKVTFTCSSTDPTDLDINVGQWVYINGDSAGTALVSNGGYARISEINTDSFVSDECTWTPVNETGTGLTVQMFFGPMIRDEAAALIVERYIQAERTLGEDDDGTQSQYLTGGVPVEWKLNLPLADKITKDVSFIALSEETRDGSTGVKTGTRVSAPVDDGYNTSSHIYRKKLFVIDPTTINNTALFARLMDGSISVNVGGKAEKEIGTIGGFAGITGNIDVKVNMNAYFATVDAQSAITAGSDVGFNIQIANDNKGITFDVPLIGIGGGQLDVQTNESIKLPLDCQAGVCANGYTMSASYFPYLPTVAMPA